MSSVFKQSAQYYSILYQHKDYQAEAAYIDSLIRAQGRNSKTLLDLGCGTGRHARCFHDAGYEVCGVDSNERMLAEAIPGTVAGKLEFHRADIRSLTLEKHFDVVTSLFHVMSYMLSNEDLHGALNTAGSHLAPGGMLIFDFWYGPAVLLDPPETRVRRLEHQNLTLIRTAEPHLLVNENIVAVDYLYFVREGGESTYRHFSEIHRMRYLFLPEIDMMLEMAGFSRIEAYGWMTTDRPGAHSRYACVVAEKRG